jgi:hypothetical protein
MYLHLFGVKKSHQIEIINAARPDPLERLGVLSRTTSLPETIALVITIPRRELEPLYRKAVVHPNLNHLCIRFWIHLSWGLWNVGRHTFMSVQPVFGKLCIASNKEEGSIVEDVKGWHGNSDLHLCGYFPTHLLYAKNINDAEISVRLSKELDTYENLQEDLGPTLEVFATCFGSKEVAMLAALPGLKVPEPTFEHSSAIEGDIQVVVSDKSFKRRITLERDTENHKALTTERAEINKPRHVL